MNKDILLTIIIPVWNQEELVIRALDSIPLRDDIEILVLDDCSTDNTFERLLDYKDTHPHLNLRLMSNGRNMGLGLTKNILYANAKGKYIHELDSDDYLYTDEYNKAIDQLDGTDIVYINMQSNDGHIFELALNSRELLCAGIARFIRKEFIGDTKCRDLKAGEDWYFNQDLLKKNPTEKFTGIIAYHYNFPREGSLYDLMVKGKL